MPSNKPRTARKETLLLARAASARGDVALARTLFASVGISYAPTYTTEGN